jgi:hypothetical protein
VKPALFTYHRTREVEDASTLLPELRNEGKMIAGSHSLSAMTNLRLAGPEQLVDTGGIRQLECIRREGASPSFGGADSHTGFAPKLGVSRSGAENEQPAQYGQSVTHTSATHIPSRGEVYIQIRNESGIAADVHA